MSQSSKQLRNHALELVRAQRKFRQALIGVRVRSGLSVAEIAELIGVSPSEVEEFEHYDSDPSLSFIRLYSLAVGCDLEFKAIPRKNLVVSERARRLSQALREPSEIDWNGSIKEPVKSGTLANA